MSHDKMTEGALETRSFFCGYFYYSRDLGPFDIYNLCQHKQGSSSYFCCTTKIDPALRMMISPGQAHSTNRGLPDPGSNPILIKSIYSGTQRKNEGHVPPAKRLAATNIIFCVLIMALESVQILAMTISCLCTLLFRPPKTPETQFRRLSRRFTANFPQVPRILWTLEEVEEEEDYEHSEY